ncbi:uncharacterized protein si:dkey-9i23.16 [Lampris incognitus]|uniref:uncharacterized protein si:dkey-9i23.16 n=1 Tax=Lampris incognitus TaxID=2546036 RepID=UPI0024B5CAED|nr:uncharacterized protein si:dkey-9i23.16 [Lampris incognitus]
MSSGGPAAEFRLHGLFPRFDPEAAAVVSILFGLFQVLLSVPLYYLDIGLPKSLFLLPLIVGGLIVAAGSLTVTTIRSPSRQLLQSCAYSNAAGLLGTLLAFCIYCFSLTTPEEVNCTQPQENDHFDFIPFYFCPAQYLTDYFRSVTALLLLYDVGAVVLHSLLSVSAFRALKAN